MGHGFRWLYALLITAVTVVFCSVGYFQYTLPDRYTVTRGESLYLGPLITGSPVESDRSVAQVGKQEQYQSSLRLLGTVPIKQVAVTVVDAPVVTVCGTPFGIKLYTDGVLIVGMSDVATVAGLVNPAAAAGVRVGDSILSINGVAVATNEEVAAQINASGGRAVNLKLRREGVVFDIVFTPVRPADGQGYRAGMWVRDSTAGVGMLTFYDAESGAFAGLGHAVCDVDTGETMAISAGEIVPARIRGVEKSLEGSPGELQGYFTPGSLGRLQINSPVGLYGTWTGLLPVGESMPVAMKQDVRTGAAQILTTVEGTTPRLYDVKIEQVRSNASASTRHMIIRITDPELLATTGGIVQGM